MSPPARNGTILRTVVIILSTDLTLAYGSESPTLAGITAGLLLLSPNEPRVGGRGVRSQTPFEDTHRITMHASACHAHRLGPRLGPRLKMLAEQLEARAGKDLPTRQVPLYDASTNKLHTEITKGFIMILRPLTTMSCAA